MKKVLSALLILILAAALVLAYQWRRAADRLGAAARGGTFQTLGIKLEVAPARGGVQGMLRLRPYLEIPQTVLDLSAWGRPGPIPLGAARLSTDLWHPQRLILVFEPGELHKEGFEARHLAFELELPDMILGLRSEILQLRNVSSGESVTLEKAWLQMGAQAALIPSNLNFRIESLRYAKEGDPLKEIHLGPIETGYTSESKGEDRTWTFFHRGQGGGFQLPKGRGELQPWSYQVKGRFAEIPWERWKQMWVQWRAAVESRSSTEPIPGAGLPSEYDAILQKTVEFFVEWRPQPERIEFRWAGMNAYDAAKEPVFLIEPVEFLATYQDSSDGLRIEAKGSLKKLALNIEGNHLEAFDAAFSQKSLHRGMKYRDWLAHIARYYSETLKLQVDPLRVLDRWQNLFLPYLAQMPDETSGDLHLELLKYDNPRYQTEHRRASLSFAVDAHAWKYRLQDNFDSLPLGDAEKTIRQGRIDLDFGFKLPWSELLTLARSSASSAESLPSFQSVFSGKPLGLDWKCLLDLGPALFAIHLDLSIDADAAEIAAATPSSWDLENKTLWKEKMLRDFFQALLQRGNLDLAIKIERLSKLQAALDKIYSGAGIGLAVLGPYVEVDAKADEMKTRLSLHEGKVLLNGAKSPSIEELLQESLR